MAGPASLPRDASDRVKKNCALALEWNSRAKLLGVHAFAFPLAVTYLNVKSALVTEVPNTTPVLPQFYPITALGLP